MTLKYLLLVSAGTVSLTSPASAQLTPDTSPKSSPSTSSTDATANPQDTPATTGQQAAPATSEGDIIVTANRRDQSLSRTPVAISVVSADTLAKANIVSETDLRQATPGLQVRTGQSSSQINFSLRGQSQDPYSNARPGVLPYFNEVQISGSAGASAFYDLQSIQVLKGPQGTLFGRSATGGALLFTTAKPTDKLGGYISGLYGNYDSYKLEGALNLPLAGDQLMLRVAGFWKGREGFQRNLYDGGREGDQKQFGVRPSLTAQFGPDVRNELVVDYYESNSENTVGVISGLLPFAGGASAPFVPAQFLYAGNRTPAALFTGVCTVQAFAGVAAACPPAAIPGLTDFYNAYFSDPRRPSSLTQALADQQARGPFTISSDALNIARTRNTVVSNTTSFEIGADTTIKNIIGYAAIRGFNAAEVDGTAFGITESGVKGGPKRGIQTTINQYSDELQVVGKALDSHLEYVVGGFVSSERTTTRQQSSLFDIVFGGIDQTNAATISNDTYAGYAQGTYRFGDSGFSLTGGGRYTSEKVGKQVLRGDTFRTALGETPPAGYDYDQSRTFNRFSYTAGAQYQASDSLLLYVTHRRAYKSGGYNYIVAPLVGSAAAGGDGYEAEKVTDVETGAKFNGFAGSMPVRLNLAGYYNWIDNRQSAGFAFINGGPAAVTVNVPKARVYGVELDGQVKPVDFLTLGGNFNYTNAKITDGNVSILGTAVAYDQVPDTPKIATAAFADVTVPVTGNLSASVHGDVYYQSSNTISPRSINNAGTQLGSYTLANFRVGVQDDTAGWSLTANLKNAFDKVYYAGGLQIGEISQINTLIPGDPRTYTLELRFKF